MCCIALGHRVEHLPDRGRQLRRELLLAGPENVRHRADEWLTPCEAHLGCEALEQGLVAVDAASAKARADPLTAGLDIAISFVAREAIDLGGRAVVGHAPDAVLVRARSSEWRRRLDAVARRRRRAEKPS